MAHDRFNIKSPEFERLDPQSFLLDVYRAASKENSYDPSSLAVSFIESLEPGFSKPASRKSWKRVINKISQ
jgi:hypothetical protein